MVFNRVLWPGEPNAFRFNRATFLALLVFCFTGNGFATSAIAIWSKDRVILATDSAVTDAISNKPMANRCKVFARGQYAMTLAGDSEIGPFSVPSIVFGALEGSSGDFSGRCLAAAEHLKTGFDEVKIRYGRGGHSKLNWFANVFNNPAKAIQVVVSTFDKQRGPLLCYIDFHHSAFVPTIDPLELSSFVHTTETESSDGGNSVKGYLLGLSAVAGAYLQESGWQPRGDQRWVISSGVDMDATGVECIRREILEDAKRASPQRNVDFPISVIAVDGTGPPRYLSEHTGLCPTQKNRE